MELEFDNEIDALLRRETRGRTITIGEFAGVHLDADEIAAFVENAVPERTRSSFMQHFAGCEPCRRTLSNAMTLRNDEAVESVAAPEIETAVPWYKRLFLFPNLAYAMGGLVLLFAGFIGLSVLNSSRQSGQFEVSKAVSNEPAAVSAPQTSFNSNAASAPANTSTNAMANAANTTDVATTDGPAKELSEDRTDDRDQLQKGQASVEQDEGRRETKPVTTQPPPAKDNEVGLFGADKRRMEPKATPAPVQLPAAERNKEETRMSAPAGPAKTKGPSRNEQQNMNQVMRDRSPNDSALKKSDRAATGGAATSRSSTERKQVSGKTFEFRSGAWYDTTYRGQGTVNVRRRTDNYKKLDSGLRGIADSFIGTVVTVWNGIAYRID